MPLLTFQELISVPLFANAHVLGGWSGKERSFLVMEESFTNISPSALLLLPLNEKHIEDMPIYLSNPHIQGLVLYGEEEKLYSTLHFPEIDEFQKPALIVNETSLHAIKKTISDMTQLKSMGHYHYVWEGMTDYWLKLIYQQGLEGMLNQLRLYVHESLTFVKSDFTPYFEQEEVLFHHELKEIRQLYYISVKKREGWSILQKDGHHYLLFPLRVGEQLFGFIILEEQPGMMIDTCIEITTRALPAMISFLKKEEAIVHTHQMYKDNFLYNLLYNNIESEHILVELGKRWEWDFTKPAQLMVVKLEPKEEYSIRHNDIMGIMGTIRSTIASSFLTAITHQLQGNLVVIVFDSFDRSGRERKEFMKGLAKSIRDSLEDNYSYISCQIGLGRQYPTNMKLYKSFYEAKIALELGKYEIHHQSILHFEDIGISRLLSNIGNDILHEYYEEILGDLIHLEQSKDDFYLETLQEFFRNNGDITKTAEQLFVHPNTLRKRIKKIEALLGCDLNQMDDQLKILVALKIMKMLT